MKKKRLFVTWIKSRMMKRTTAAIFGGPPLQLGMTWPVGHYQME
jgi:hypothetical protein